MILSSYVVQISSEIYQQPLHVSVSWCVCQSPLLLQKCKRIFLSFLSLTYCQLDVLCWKCKWSSSGPVPKQTWWVFLVEHRGLEISEPVPLLSLTRIGTLYSKIQQFIDQQASALPGQLDVPRTPLERYFGHVQLGGGPGGLDQGHTGEITSLTFFRNALLFPWRGWRTYCCRSCCFSL